MNEGMECRLKAIEMAEQAAKHNYEERWAIVALAASVLQVAAVVWELFDFLRWAFDEYMKKDKRRE